MDRNAQKMETYPLDLSAPYVLLSSGKIERAVMALFEKRFQGG